MGTIRKSKRFLNCLLDSCDCERVQKRGAQYGGKNSRQTLEAMPVPAIERTQHVLERTGTGRQKPAVKAEQNIFPAPAASSDGNRYSPPPSQVSMGTRNTSIQTKNQSGSR